MTNNMGRAWRALIGIISTCVALSSTAQAAGALASRADADAAFKALQAQAGTTSASAADTRSCGMWYFGILGSRCLYYNNTTGGVGYAGAQGPQSSQCPTIPVGQVTSAVTAPTAGSTCYQFVVSGSVSMPVEVALPTNVTGLAELFVMYPNGLGIKITEARTGTPLSLNFSTTNQRIALVFRPFSGPGGQNFNIGLGVPAPAAPIALNDTQGGATIVQMNRIVNSTISTPGSSAGYYFYPLNPGETQATYAITRTANQTVGIRAAQLLGAGSFAVGPETIVPLSASGQPSLISGMNSNLPGTTTPYGFMVRVSGANAAAPVDEAYSVRLGSAGSYIFATTTDNTESISRYYPISGAIQVATYLTVTAKIKDVSGSFSPNEPVVFEFVPNINVPGTVQKIVGIANEFGDVSLTANFPACSGTTLSASNYGPFGSPTDHWNGTAQLGTLTIKVAGVNPPAGFSNQSVIPFTRICTETYLGRY